MTALDTKPAADSLVTTPGKPFVRIFLPVATAVSIALTSFVTLAAYDKPLDRHALMPSVFECDDTRTSEAAPASDAQGGTSDAHAMLLRYDLQQSKLRPSLL